MRNPDPEPTGSDPTRFTKPNIGTPPRQMALMPRKFCPARVSDTRQKHSGRDASHSERQSTALRYKLPPTKLPKNVFSDDNGTASAWRGKNPVTRNFEHGAPASSIRNRSPIFTNSTPENNPFLRCRWPLIELALAARFDLTFPNS